MGEHRKESFSILLKKTSKTYQKIKLYESTLWADQLGACEGKFRLKVNGKWFSPYGEKYNFRKRRKRCIFPFNSAVA